MQEARGKKLEVVTIIIAIFVIISTLYYFYKAIAISAGK